MKTIERTKQYSDSPEEVFDCLDDLGVTGMHMTQSSMLMMGGKMALEFLTANKRGWRTEYRWTGKVLWMPLDFTVLVTRWKRGTEKSWETVDHPKMIIMSWFRMDLSVEGHEQQTTAHLSITYERPSGSWNRFLSSFLADLYCRWCLNNMLNDTEKRLRQRKNSMVTAV